MSNHTKPTPTQHEIHELIRDRWSPRAFTDQKVTPEVLGQLFEAARWAPSSFNEQPWRFLVATKEQPAEYDKLLKCLVEFNQSWAGAAPVLMLSVARLQFAKNGKANSHCWHDVGLATQNLLLQATALGLSTHSMAGFNAAQARATFNIPEGFEPVAVTAIGYAAPANTLPDDLQEQEESPRSRNPQADFVFTGDWETTADFAKPS